MSCSGMSQSWSHAKWFCRIAKAHAVLGVLALLATAALVPHLGNVTVPSQPRGGLLGTVLSAALHVDGTGEDEART